MKIRIKKSLANGVVAPPPSKSYAHRILIASALANGESDVFGIIPSDDMKATENCLKALGADIVAGKRENEFLIKGIGKVSKAEKRVFECNESGSTLRFFIPIALLGGGVCEFRAKPRLIARGIEVYEQIFKEQNINFSKTEDTIVLSGSLKGGEFSVRGDISSQFISGLLFALPLLDTDSTVNLTTNLESKEYVDITIDVLRQFGIVIEKRENSYFIKGNQTYKAIKNIEVEKDLSNAAFLEAFNLISNQLTVTGVNKNSLQPDRVYIDLFEKLKNGGEIIDISQCPDLAPVLFSVSAMYNGAHFTGTRRLKIKESDRAEAMKEELAKFGIWVEVFENDAIVHAQEIKKPTVPLSSHSDHRIVMALSVLASITGAEIEGAENVNKSYPDFFKVISSLGIEVEYEV